MTGRGEPGDERPHGDVPSEGAQAAEVTRLVAQHGGYITRLLVRFGVAESDVSDARQEVFLVVWRRFADFEHRSNATTWLYTICRRVAKDLRRRAHRRHETPALAHREAAVDAAQERAFDAKQQFARIEVAFAELSEDKQHALVACALDGARIEHIASAQGCPEKTVFSRLYAARAHLRCALDRVAAWFPWWGQMLRVKRRGPVLAARSTQLAFGASCATAIAALLLGIFKEPAPAVLGWSESGASARMSPFIGLGLATPTQVEASVRPRDQASALGVPDPAVPQAMQFTVLDIETPGAALAMQQVAFMRYEPRVLDAAVVSAGLVGSDAPWYGAGGPVTVKPKLVRERR